MRISSSRSASTSGGRRQMPLLQRQTSVLHELQESHDKENWESRNVRLMTELAALCSNRENVLTPESLEFLAGDGRVEPVKLEREPEKPADAALKAAQASRQEDASLSADAARRQRVEELTRFFMEAKSDIEFALGGNRDFRESRDKDRDGDSERDDEKEMESGDEDEDAEKNEDDQDPTRRVARRHYRLLKDKVDDRVFNGMLIQIRESEPALYGAILCHPLVTGFDAKKDKRKKKKRKEGERKALQSATAAMSTMLAPDFNSPRLTHEDAKSNIARFVARAIADGSMQGLLLALKLVLSWLLEAERTDVSGLKLPLVTHLQVLRGEKGPDYPVPVRQESMVPADQSDSKVSNDLLTRDSASRAGAGELSASLTAEDAAMSTMEIESDGESLAVARPRESQFGRNDGDMDDHDIHHDDDDDDDYEEEEEDDEGDSIGGDVESVDEDALMARAIALSLSPEMNLRDQSSIEETPGPATLSLNASGPTDNEGRARPAPFSSDEILNLGPFCLPAVTEEVDAVTVAVSLASQIGHVCLQYLESCRKGVLPSSGKVQPHPLVFMLLHSVMDDLLHASPSWIRTEYTQATWKLFTSCSLYSLLRSLETQFFHVEATSTSPASVGLGRVVVEPNVGNRLVENLKNVVEEALSQSHPSEMTDCGDVMTSVVFATGCSAASLLRVKGLYDSQVREHALVSWARGIAHFYPSQKSRHDLLVELLQACARTESVERDWVKFAQLELLCARLASPDLAQGFVPQCGDVVVSGAGDTSVTNLPKSVLGDVKTIDDAAIVSACQKNSKIKLTSALWRPEVIRASLQSGSVTPRCLLDFLTETSSPESLEAAGLSGLVLPDARANDLLATTYEQHWEASQKEEIEAMDCLSRLPALVDLLRECVLHPSWPRISIAEDFKMAHAPLLGNFDHLKREALCSTSARVIFLRAIQDLMLLRLGGARSDDPPALEFDPARCAETMTLSDGNKTARQFTAKQWGMVMATTGCPPNSGTHEWAVRLDRCEKGHIFLGVCTRDASVATYVGGDRQGWGLIGTRALWHNRSKVRGDYGDGFSTGTVVRVRLNTDSGALSFGVDDSDWGIAFDGLTQHGTLFPAIGLYQRDDQVTILPVRSSESEALHHVSASASVRNVVVPAILHPFLHHTASIIDTTCKFLRSPEAAAACREGIACRSATPVENLLKHHPLLFSLVTPLISSLSTLKNFHGLSTVLAWHFVPWFTRLLRQLDWFAVQLREIQALPNGPVALNVSGEWELKSMASGNIPAQQYHLTLSQDSRGTLSGKSTGSSTTVTLSGSVGGTKVRFMETWRQGGTCLVEGRLRADGGAFTGTYEDAKSHTSGSIVGQRLRARDGDEPSAGQHGHVLQRLLLLEVVCGNLVGQLSRALIDCEKPDLLVDQFTRAVEAEDESETPTSSADTGMQDAEAPKLQGSAECSSDEYEGWVNSMLLSGGLPASVVQEHLKDVMNRIVEVTRIRPEVYSLPELAVGSHEWLQYVTPKALTLSSNRAEERKSGLENDVIQDLIHGRGAAASVDRWVSRHVGESPLLRVGGEPMKVAKRTVCAAMVWHSGFLPHVKKLVEKPHADVLANSEERPHENLMHIWRAAQRVIEWAIRAKNSMGSTYAVVAALVIRKADFLLKMEPCGKAVAASTAVSVLSQDTHLGPAPPARSAVYDCAERIYSEVLMQVSRFLEAPIRISSLQSRMLAHSTRAFLRIVGMLSFRFFVGDASSSTSREVLQSSFTLTAGLQWLSPASHSSSLSSAAMMKEIVASSDAFENGASSSGVLPSSKSANGHYLSGLGGCGKQLESDIQEAFESLYGFLSAALSKATWAHDTDLQLVLLEAWGIVIQPDDHAFLSRVGIFRVLQTVLDDARSQDVSSNATSRNESEQSRVAESRRSVVQATLKVVHLLAAQVAHVGEESDAFVLPTSTSLASFGGLASGAIPLLRKPSGPETLGKSVFHMLYTELKNALEEMRVQRSSEKTVGDLSVAMESNQVEPAETELAPGTSNDDTTDSQDGGASGFSDVEEYCYQICSLLYSVSGSSVCRSHLSSSRWLRLLLVLLELGSLQIQRRSLKLLRRILPDLDPATIKLRPDAMDVFDVDSDDEGDSDGIDSVTQATALISFFMGIVSSMSPPSLVGAMLRRLSSRPDEVETTSPGFSASTTTAGLAGDVVLLLRSLYQSPKWSSHLSATIAKALLNVRVVSTRSEEDAKATTATDQDVEMEDASAGTKSLPTLDTWTNQCRSDLNAFAALCVMDGHIESLRVGATVKLLPKGAASSSVQDTTFRGARALVVAYGPEKTSAEVVLKPNRSSESNSGPGSRVSALVSSRPIRVPIEDLVPVPDIELDTSVFSDEVLTALLVTKFQCFMDEIRRSQEQLKESDDQAKAGDASMDEPDEDDDMSDDESVASPSNTDSEPMGASQGPREGGDMDSDEEQPEATSQRVPVDLDGVIDAKDVAREIENEAQLNKMLLCQHGLRATALLLRDKRAAEIFVRGGAASGNLLNLLRIAIFETPTAGLAEISSLEESWSYLWTRWYNLRCAAANPAPKKHPAKKGGDNAEEAEGPPNPMIQQMMEMGFPKEWCEVALLRCSQNVEAAINFCFEHSSDMERLVAQYKAAKETSANANSGGGTKSVSRAEAEALLISPLLEQLAEMGFPPNWCKKALAANRNNVDAALTWILSNGEALEAEDRREEEAKQRALETNDSAVKVDVPDPVPETPKPNPLRAVSGQATIGELDSMVEGLVGAGFPSVGAPDCLVSRGRWYYEATLLTNGCIQIGWADVAFNGSADRGDGVGDGAHSWAYDGWRQQKWHGQSSPWGSKWKQGDVVGCGVDVDAGIILFSLNGKMRSANMGIAFRGVEFAHGVFPCASFNRRERLQFNLGGSPFKFGPPPGFRPILEVLCKEGETIADLPKGFSVIGRGEDCLEESVGEENFSSDSRYFGREAHPSLARTTGSSSTSARGASLLAGSNRAEMFAELKAIPDDRVYVELLLLSRSLAVLHARRALLTLLAKWPAERVGDFSMQFLEAPPGSTTSPAGSSLFMEFVKLIASGSGGSVSTVVGTPLSVDSSEVDELLDLCTSGRHALSLLLPVTRSALDSSLLASSGSSQRQHLLEVTVSRISVEVQSASLRAYARVPWDATDALVTASFLQLSSEAGQAWSDKEVLKHPNLFLAEWLSRLLMDSLSRYEHTLDESTRNFLRIELLKSWLAAFKSPGLCVKEKAFGLIGGILQDTLLKAALAGTPASRDLVEQVLKALSLNRLLDLAEERLLKEYAQLPVCSRYLQSIVELVSAGSLASRYVGFSTDALFDRDVSRSLAASHQLEADLFDIDKRECDEEMERRRVLAQEAAAKAALEAAEAAAAEAKADAERVQAEASGAEASGDQQMLESETPPAQQEDNNNTVDSSTNMEVDSDSEDHTDLTLSAIADMVAEDSDVVSAAAAIAAAAGGRLTIKHVIKRAVGDDTTTPPSTQQPPALPAFIFPEEELSVDAALLNAVERNMLEAGSRGILGDEPLPWRHGGELGLLSDTATKIWSGQLTQHKLIESEAGDSDIPELTVGCKVIRGPNWKWRDQDGGDGSIGVVEGVSPWSGVEGEGMSVRWPNDSLYTYRWGADGNYDLIHVVVDDDGNVVTKYPTPQVKPEEEGTFGCELHLGVLLHLSDEGSEIVELPGGGQGTKVTGVMELPDFGAAVYVVGAKPKDGGGRVLLQEVQLVRGNADMGWTMRFGSEKWLPGAIYTLSPVEVDGVVDESVLRGEFSHFARRDGKLVRVAGELRVTTKTLFTMDPSHHFSTLSISDEGMTVTCNSGESRNLALGTVGFASGVHYWEVRVDQAEFGSVFIGVCEKAGPPGSQAALSNRLNRWTGWGFVNFRATYHNSTERIYGDHFNAGDTIGVRLDMEQGKLSFFMDGMKFGEHIVADLGVAFDSMKGERNSRVLYPCIGMRKSGDRVALNGKWVSLPGVSPRQLLCDALDASASLHSWYLAAQGVSTQPVQLSDRLLTEGWYEWKRWAESRWQRYPVRPRGVFVDFDTYPSSCIAVSKAAGLGAPFLAGDRVRVCSTYGRELTQPEEAVILGVYRGSLWYRTETQGNEGSDEGRSWAWYFSPSELAELLLVRRNGKDMTLIENNASEIDEETLAGEMIFPPQSDLEAQAHRSFEAFVQLATEGHTPASDMQLVERLNVFCAASGVDITNVRIGSIVTPNEAASAVPRSTSHRVVSRAFVHDEYFSSPALKTISGPQLRARCAILRVFNGKIARSLPLIALQPSEAVKDPIEVANAGGDTSAEYPSTSVKIRALRRLIFTSTKRSYWDAVIRATTTSTPLPSDEYEDPREIRTIRINRIQAQASKLSLLAQPSDRLRRSVFGQLYREMRTWNDNSYRRAYCGKGHGGQKRAFKVKFIGEGVNDYGGPYRAVFEQVVDELQMDNVELSKGEQGLLPLLIPCPNRRSGTGSNQDKFLLNPSCGTSLISSGPVALDLHRFLGKIIGTAVRHGLQMGLDLPSLVWRPLAGLDVNRAHLESVDVVATNNLARVEEADESNAQDILEYLTFTTTLSDGTEVPLSAGGDKQQVTLANRLQYVKQLEKKRLTESQQQLAALRDGLSAVLPMELAPLFTPRELEVLICGRREVDVDLLRQCTEYGESVDESMAHVQSFWEVLKEMSSEERTSFLRFVWARSRMPNSAKDFPMNFKIQSAHDSGAQVDPDKYLPHAQTCFFALRLPTYSSKDILREKLLYAIQNSPNMDADVRLHNAEGWADA